MIQTENLTKRYGGKTVVDNLSITVRPGIVTGFLGPNGAGKSTTMRMILGLEDPSSGTATIGGARYRDIATPLRTVGAMLDAGWVHPKRSGRDHLRWVAASNGLPASRVDEVLDTVGLSGAGSKRAGQYSLGMRQRLGLATALLGDPQYYIFDEPVNGLDPEGIVWIRQIMRRLASQGRTVLVSSHLLSEMALTADHLLVIAQGRLIADTTVTEFVSEHSGGSVRVRARDYANLVPALERLGGTAAVQQEPIGDVLIVNGLTVEEIGETAAASGTIVFEITQERGSLEDAFMSMTQDAVEYRGGSRSEVLV